ncbi:hypothetical protein JIN85_19025 [Luteolibacter pohnpeiensis]|uniref:Uncharacterized protein n=1 Tax=Luteolibacter pohnpeiensis TaxID=454153 RepID=A0A934SE91_9BACT|nr:hypothetical protein [Luteolibacter pohnpeiensis]MBK1884517.1 hypothetical protein [Luteolibacter pohnpeiensis]
MNRLSQTDTIWNRACSGGISEARSGDRALANLLRAHGLTINGGVLHAVECLTEIELNEAEAGYRFYGLDSISSMLSRAKGILISGEDTEDYESVLDEEYYEKIPDDDFLVGTFENHFRSNPSAYEPT